MNPMLTIAVRAARKAGSVINLAAKELHKIPVEQKKHHDFVTEVDRAAERAIIEILKGAYPNHDFLGEEGGAQSAQKGIASDYLWIIDPLDGTTNFIHGFPQYAVSIGLAYKGKLTEAVIYDPTRDELFTASRGQGALLNNQRMRVSACTQLSAGLIGNGFAIRSSEEVRDYMSLFKIISDNCAGMRCAGSAALNLAYVAAGRLDGFFEKNLSPWDIAAGALLILESGGMVGDFDGNSNYLYGREIIAAPPQVFAQMVQKISSPSEKSRM